MREAWFASLIPLADRPIIQSRRGFDHRLLPHPGSSLRIPRESLSAPNRCPEDLDHFLGYGFGVFRGHAKREIREVPRLMGVEVSVWFQRRILGARVRDGSWEKGYDDGVL